VASFHPRPLGRLQLSPDSLAGCQEWGIGEIKRRTGGGYGKGMGIRKVESGETEAVMEMGGKGKRSKRNGRVGLPK